MMKRLMTTIALCAVMAVPAAAAPFGIEMGDTYTSKQAEKTENGLRLRRVPKPHSSFSSYYVAPSNVTGGACTVVAFTNDLPRSRYNEIATVFDSISTQLGSRYGKPDAPLVDLGLSEVAAVTWWKDPLPDNIFTMTLKLRTNADGSYYVSLNYSFANWRECGSEDTGDNAAL
jgi:hypothetical protein